MEQQNNVENKEKKDESKKLNDDLIVFMRKRSETDAPGYGNRLRNYVDLQKKRRRAAAARRHIAYNRPHMSNYKMDAEKDGVAKKDPSEKGEMSNRGSGVLGNEPNKGEKPTKKDETQKATRPGRKRRSNSDDVCQNESGTGIKGHGSDDHDGLRSRSRSSPSDRCGRRRRRRSCRRRRRRSRCRRRRRRSRCRRRRRRSRCRRRRRRSRCRRRRSRCRRRRSRRRRRC